MRLAVPRYLTDLPQPLSGSPTAINARFKIWGYRSPSRSRPSSRHNGMSPAVLSVVSYYITGYRFRTNFKDFQLKGQNGSKKVNLKRRLIDLLFEVALMSILIYLAKHHSTGDVFSDPASIVSSLLSQAL